MQNRNFPIDPLRERNQASVNTVRSTPCCSGVCIRMNLCSFSTARHAISQKRSVDVKGAKKDVHDGITSSAHYLLKYGKGTVRGCRRVCTLPS